MTENEEIARPAAAPEREAEAVARECFGLPEPQATALAGGRINETYLLASRGDRYVLQRLNDFFENDEALGLNWRRIVLVLTERPGGLQNLVPPIHPDLAGRFLARPATRPGAWRLTGFRSGRPARKDRADALASGRALGRLHRALNSPAPAELLPLPEGEFTNRRLTAAGDMETLLERYRRHPHLEELKPLIEKIAEASLRLPGRPTFLDVFRCRESVIHGDPKADNFLMDDRGEIAAALDWDTAGLGHILADAGEMARSFGSRAQSEAELDAAAATAEGYAETGPELSEADLELLPAVWRGLALNLARRYLTDALAEVYFHWDSRAWPSLYEQNRRRAEELLELAENLFSDEMSLIDLFKRAAARGLARRTAELPEAGGDLSAVDNSLFGGP